MVLVASRAAQSAVHRRLDCDERSLSSAMPAVADPAKAARDVYNPGDGFRPLQPSLDDGSIENLDQVATDVRSLLPVEAMGAARR